MQRLRGWLGRAARRPTDPGSPGKIAWRPTLLAGGAAIAAIAIYEAFKYLTH